LINFTTEPNSVIITTEGTWWWVTGIGLNDNWNYNLSDIDTTKNIFLRGKIEIQNIHEILKGKARWSGIKPALARKGLIIKFNIYGEIYIAPENNDEMISDLLKLNSKIKIS
jgi:hypothetical protein